MSSSDHVTLIIQSTKTATSVGRYILFGLQNIGYTRHNVSLVFIEMGAD